MTWDVCVCVCVCVCLCVCFVCVYVPLVLEVIGNPFYCFFLSLHFSPFTLNKDFFLYLRLTYFVFHYKIIGSQSQKEL